LIADIPVQIEYKGVRLIDEKDKPILLRNDGRPGHCQRTAHDHAVNPTWQKYPSKRLGIGLLVEVAEFVFGR
jgi:hypothetical protein